MPAKKHKSKPLQFRPGSEYIMLGRPTQFFQPEEAPDYDEVLEVLRRFINRPDNRKSWPCLKPCRKFSP